MNNTENPRLAAAAAVRKAAISDAVDSYISACQAASKPAKAAEAAYMASAKAAADVRNAAIEAADAAYASALEDAARKGDIDTDAEPGHVQDE